MTWFISSSDAGYRYTRQIALKEDDFSANRLHSNRARAYRLERNRTMLPPQESDPGSGSYEILRLNLERISAAVEGEYTENDRRLNWFLLFQAFLFQGYATALQAITGASNHASPEVAHARALLVVIIAIGTLTTVLTIRSTRAGVQAIEILKTERETVTEKVAEQLGILKVGFPVTDKLHHLGLLPTRWAPPTILSAWACVIIHAVYVNLLAI